MGARYRGSEEERLALDTFVKLNRCVSSVSARLAAGYPFPGSLTASQFGVLEALLHCGPLSQLELGEKILKSKGNVSTVVDNLERAGLVKRERDRDDRRCVLVRLSPRGRQLIRRIFPRHARAIYEEMSALSGEEQEQLGRLCKKLGMKEEMQ
jgi:MarR family 2-MHQ and catechol resistance regulon transcriptional repressor